METNNSAKYSKSISLNLGWILIFIVFVIDFIAWKSRYGSTINLSALIVFPLLGLLDWTAMWTHYIMSARDIIYGKPHSSKYYWIITRIAVLTLILMHPLLLAWNQWRVSGSLPPVSFYSYVASSLKLFVVFGTLSLIIFLSFELFNHLKDKKWVNQNYKWIELSQIFAMVLIWFHALKLGTSFGSTLFTVYWYFLGLTLLPCFYLVAKRAFTTKI